MRALIIGVGAAGNKAAIDLIENNVVPKEDTILVNSTLKDVPQEYREIAIEIEGPNGCGQERSLAKEIVLQAMKFNKFNLEQLIEPMHEKVIVLASLCGATGSGMAPVIARYYSQVINIPTEIIGLVGFEDESARALRNIMEFCQDLDDSFTVQFVRNTAFLKAAKQNRTKAEKLANLEVVDRVRIMLGRYMIDSEQNIDETDIKKLNNREGYKTVEYLEIEDKIKSMEQFNDYLKEMLDDTKSFDPDGSKIGLLGVIMNLQSSSQEYIDRSYRLIREKLGEPYEVYTHIQYNEQAPEFIAFIASGMKMPEDQIKKIYNNYQELTGSVNKKEDDFFNTVQTMQGNEDDDQFDSFARGKFKKELNTDDQAAEERDKFFVGYERVDKKNPQSN